jgi:hypothetical protein
MQYQTQFKDFAPEGHDAVNTLIITVGDHKLHLWFKNETVGEVIHYYPEETADCETIISLKAFDRFFLDTGAKIVGLAHLIGEIQFNYRDIYKRELNK